MVTDSGIVLPRVCRTGSFVGLMTLYESNFVRLRWIIADARAIDAQQVSHVPEDLPLHLRGVECTRYTTTINLTYCFEEAGRCIPDPDLYVRIYHDAGLVEAMDCCSRHRHRILQPYDTDAGTELRRRWLRNMMLNKWLEYCADKGHRFGESKPVVGSG